MNDSRTAFRFMRESSFEGALLLKTCSRAPFAFPVASAVFLAEKHRLPR